MASKRKKIRLSYRWRLFLPVLLLVWGVIAVMVWVQYQNEEGLRREMLQRQLAMVNRRVLFNLSRGVDTEVILADIDKQTAFQTQQSYNVSVYDTAADTLLGSIGEPIPMNENDLRVVQGLGNNDPLLETAIVQGWDYTRLYLYTSQASADRRIMVLSALSYDFSLASLLAVNKRIWIMALLVTLVATVVVYFSTRWITRSINLLRNFAIRAARGEPIDNSMILALPDNELGDISHDIFHLYEQGREARERSERDHRVARHAIEDKTRMKRQLTNNINHELKTPVGIVRGYLETLAEDPEMPPEMRARFLQQALQNVERMCTLLNDLSTITRLDNDPDGIAITDVNVHDLLFGIENDVKVSGLDGGMQFTFDVPVDCEVKANADLLTGMILNLIKNAALYSGGTKMCLRLVSESKKFYVFTFYDDGSGVPQEHVSHLFERFYRVDSGRSRKAGGTGLGLAIVKDTVVALGGAISVHNRSTGGLEFVFSLKK